MGSDSKDVIDKLFSIILQTFQQAQETSSDNGSKCIPESVELLDYYFQRIIIRRAESYIISPDWIVNKKATINPKNKKDNKCFQRSVISGLNYNKTNKKYLKKIEKIKKVDIDLSLYHEHWENLYFSCS